MRILLVAQFYPPTIGGEERHVRNLALALVGRGHRVSVATLRHGNDPLVEMDCGVRVHRIRGTMQRVSMLFTEQHRQYAPPFADPELLLALRQIISTERPDIIHAHNWLVHSMTPLKAWSRAKLVVTLHDYGLACVQQRLTYKQELCDGPALTKCMECAAFSYGAGKGIPSLLTSWVAGKLENQATDMFLAVSQAVADGTQLARRRVPYRVVPNFVPDTVAAQCDDTHPLLAHLPDGDFLLFVGDVRRDKGVGVLLEAYAALPIQVPLVLIGTVRNDMSLTIPPNVLLLRSWPHAAVMSAWRRCTIALAPSIWHDPCPTVAMEAMAMGRPVIASRIGGLRDIVEDGKTGLLVPPGDANALRDAMQTLLADAPRREQMGAMGKQRVTNFQASTVVAQIERVYQEVLAV